MATSARKQMIKLWGMPIILGVLTMVGLISAILGVGFWHYISWLTLSVPLYYSFKYGAKFFS